MPDSVRCSVDTNHVFTCEVDIGPEPSAATNATAATAAPAPAPAAPPVPPPASPAVSALAGKFVLSRHEVHAPKVDAVTVGSAGNCVSQLAAAPLLLMSLKAPMLSVLTGAKVGWDASACLAKDMLARQASADRAEAVKYCEARGGEPTGFVEQDLICAEPAPVTP